MKIMFFIYAIIAAGCATPTPTAPQVVAPVAKPVPATPKAPAAPKPTADEVFDREVDACFAEYRKCQKSGKGEAICFPPQERCVIKAYRKLKRSRSQWERSRPLFL